MPVVTCLPGSNWSSINHFLEYTTSDHEYPAITQIPKAQVDVEAQNMVDKSVQTELNLVEITCWSANQEPEQQDESGSRQKSSSNQPSKNQPSKQNKNTRNDKGYESGSEYEQINDENGDDDDNEDDKRRRGYEASDETSNDDEDEEDDTEEEDDEPTPPPVSRKRKARTDEESRREKTLKRRRPPREEEEETDDESGPMKKRSRPEKRIIHEYYREIGRSGKDEFRMEDLFDDNEIKVIHDFLSEIGKMRARRRQEPKRKEGNGRRTSGKQKSSQSRLERKHSDIYESYSKGDQELIHDYYQQIGHKGGKYRGSDVDEEELEQEDRKVHPGFLKEKRQRQQNVVHDFLSKVAKQKRWGQAPDNKRRVKKTGKMRSDASREI